MRIYGLFLCILMWGCTKCDTVKKVQHVQRALIVRIKSLDSIILGNADNIQVTFAGGDEWGASAHDLEANLIGDTLFLKAYYIYPNDIPPDAIILDTINARFQLNYIFKPGFKGTYTYTPYERNTSAKTVVY